MSDKEDHQTAKSNQIDRSFLALLRCPSCQQQPLEQLEDGLSCKACERVFPVVDGIPSLFPDEDSQT